MRVHGIRALASPPTITPSSRCSLGSRISRTGAGAAASGASPWSDAANCLLAVPFVLEAFTTFYKGFWVNGAGTLTGSTATEVGIWDAAFAKIVTTGSVGQANNASVPQVAALSATVSLGPGLYYMGMAHAATTTGHFFRWSAGTAGNFWQALGCFRQSGITIGSLAATATPGDMTNVGLPLFGLITRSAFDA